MNPLRTTTFAVALTALLGLAPPTRSAHALAPVQDPGPPAGNLVFTPEAPRPGSTVTVRYHPAESLAGEPELILRGHFRIAKEPDSGLGARNGRIATLAPAGDGSFTASFRLPELAAHGVFVVEDIAGERLDTNGGRHFDLLVHGEDKSSLADALSQRAAYYQERDPAIASRSIERAMELRREVVAEENPGDSVTMTFTGSSVMLTAEDLERIGLPDVRWVRTWERWRQDGDSRAALDDFEAEWPAVGHRRPGMSSSALLIAVRTLDLAAVDRWAGRILDNGWTDPWSEKLMVARMISQIPVRRDRALELARGAMADLDAVDFARDPGRQLGQTAGEYAGVVTQARADALVKHSRLLAEAGFEEQSLEVLEAATAESAEPDLFRRLGELRLARGDAAGAALAFAVVASDPGTLPAEARALAGRAGHSADSPEWHRLLESAAATVLPRALAGAVRRSLPPVRVADAEGERLALEQIVGGKPAVVVFWARWCGPCIAEIPEVARLAQALEPRGVRLVSVSTDDVPGAEMDAWLRDRRVTYPVYYDLDGEAWSAFGAEYISAVFVLDANGLVRFEHSHVEGVWRQLEALGLLAGGRRSEGERRLAGLPRPRTPEQQRRPAPQHDEKPVRQHDLGHRADRDVLLSDDQRDHDDYRLRPGRREQRQRHSSGPQPCDCRPGDSHPQHPRVDPVKGIALHPDEPDGPDHPHQEQSRRHRSSDRQSIDFPGLHAGDSLRQFTVPSLRSPLARGPSASQPIGPVEGTENEPLDNHPANPAVMARPDCRGPLDAVGSPLGRRRFAPWVGLFRHRTRNFPDR